MTALGVALAGGLGAALRFLVDAAVTARVRSGWGWGLVVVNVSGSFAIGVATGLLPAGTGLTIVAVGLLGGYTTFSSASIDTAQLALRGHGGRAVAHAMGTACACVGAAWLGLLMT